MNKCYFLTRRAFGKVVYGDKSAVDNIEVIQSQATDTPPSRLERMFLKPKCFKLFFLFILLSIASSMYENNYWQRPGCHKVGHTKTVRIPDCVEFHLTTNACRGYCESWSVPSPVDTLKLNPFQMVTSVGQCCNIMETEEVQVRVKCVGGARELTFKSAKNCSCYHCKKD